MTKHDEIQVYTAFKTFTSQVDSDEIIKQVQWYFTDEQLR